MAYTDSVAIRSRAAAIPTAARWADFRVGWAASTSVRVNTAAGRASTSAGDGTGVKKPDGAVRGIASNFTPESAILKGCLIEMC
ncbi:hypothetical protein MTY59_21720 [Mycobacterium senriense]|uniref:Uncharacterized protein n=1 Tax=Mycobacterium senriense TaxID=2775496 RepID=A0ABN6IJZ0_9MYCO|nr:hypothetical protein MTY59_21720 [Mycobacterium senriense]